MLRMRTAVLRISAACFAGLSGFEICVCCRGCGFYDLEECGVRVLFEFGSDVGFRRRGPECPPTPAALSPGGGLDVLELSC